MKLNSGFRLILPAILLGVCMMTSATAAKRNSPDKNFLRVEGENIVDRNGEPFFIKGTNLGNWLNPEGYMFGFKRTNSPWMINDALCELIGPTATAEFWREFKENYITEDDFRFIASTGANTIRLPFNYKLFTTEDYMGLNDDREGYRRIDDCIRWARSNNLRLILDMHDCPGGQTGDNIDDSYGYPWLLVDSVSQRKFIDIWCAIADRYKDEDVILGYELANEPIATYWEGEEREYLNSLLEPLYKRTTEAIRRHDKNHIILLGGPQWNSHFGNFTDWTFDNNIMYTCHRYGGDPTSAAIGNFVEFRDKTGLPMYMGETGHNTEEWLGSMADAMRQNNIGYTYWPYKKINDSAMTGVKEPEGWSRLVEFVEAPRGTYEEIRAARQACPPDTALKLLKEFISNSTADRMLRHQGYIQAIKLDK